MFVGYFTERPYQDREADWYQQHVPMIDLDLSNGGLSTRSIGADLYHRYLDEKLYAEEMGFDGVMLNAHHSTPFCMGGGAMNVEAAILARITEKLKIVLLGNVLPIWDDPLWLVEELAMIDVISRGPARLRLGAGHRPRESSPTTPSRRTTGSASRRPTTSSSRRGRRRARSAGRASTTSTAT